MPTEAAQPLIHLRNVAKDYVSAAGTVHALKEVDLSIDAGEFVAIVGSSGSGKSTLMNILGCLDRPTRGVYELAGLDVGGRSNDGRALVRNRLIGFIFQGFNLLPRTTALENCELPLVYRGVAVADRRKRAMGSLTAVGLGDRVHHTPNQLSGGQQQRVAIARALVTDPPLLLADEPTGNLDTRTSLEVLALLQRLNVEVGITIVLVTHEPDIAACASRVITVRDGYVVSDVRHAKLDAAKELLALPNVEAGAHDDEEGGKRARKHGEAPLPRMLYVAAFAAGLGGLLVGTLYEKFVLASSLPPLVVALGLLFEAYAGARYGRRSFGRVLDADERFRLARGLTLYLTLPLVLVAGWIAIAKATTPLVVTLHEATGRTAAIAILSFVLGAACLTGLRYVLLGLFAPRPAALLGRRTHASP